MAGAESDRRAGFSEAAEVLIDAKTENVDLVSNRRKSASRVIPLPGTAAGHVCCYFATAAKLGLSKCITSPCFDI